MKAGPNRVPKPTKAGLARSTNLYMNILIIKLYNNLSVFSTVKFCNWYSVNFFATGRRACSVPLRLPCYFLDNFADLLDY